MPRRQSSAWWLASPPGEQRAPTPHEQQLQADMTGALLTPLAEIPTAILRQLVPEQRLVLSILMLAIDDATNLKPKYLSRTRSARRWLTSTSTEIRSSVWCCDHLGIDHARLVAWVRDLPPIEAAIAAELARRATLVDDFQQSA